MGRTSRTTDPDGAPYRWELFATKTARVVENELDRCLRERCTTQYEYDMLISRVEARLERASQGGLGGSDDEPSPDPVVSQPALWETRWSFKKRRELRLYHGEPLSVPDLLFGLKYHWKRLDGLSADEIESAQNAEMAEAATRYRASSCYSSADEQPHPN